MLLGGDGLLLCEGFTLFVVFVHLRFFFCTLDIENEKKILGQYIATAVPKRTYQKVSYITRATCTSRLLKLIYP